MVVIFFYALSVVFALFTYFNRNHPVFKMAQPVFLYAFISGTIIGISAVIPLTIDTHTTNEQAYKLGSFALARSEHTYADKACVSIPWLIMIGYGLVVPVLVAKSHRQHLILQLAYRCIRKTVPPHAFLPFLTFSLFVRYLHNFIFHSSISNITYNFY
jgi:7 transmembrane sweet-taste receptor of 3 GCPR